MCLPLRRAVSDFRNALSAVDYFLFEGALWKLKRIVLQNESVTLKRKVYTRLE